MTTEEWRPVPGYDGYEVSDLGRVRSWRQARPGGWVRRRAPHILATTISSRPGYYSVGLGHHDRQRIHILVAAAFLGPRPAGHVVRHLNDDSLDNRLSNIAYGTHGDNYADAVANGLRPRTAGRHGIENTYRNGCRCDACRVGRATRSAAQRAARKTQAAA